MTVGLYTIIVSPHQLPLARELAARVGAANFRYVIVKSHDSEREGMGWGHGESKECFRIEGENAESLAFLETCEVLLVGGIRPIELLERRVAHGRTTLYMSERWFKPIPVCGGRLRLPGWLRMLVPGYRRMARRFAALFASPHYRYLPIGPWAAYDMVKMCRMAGASCRESEFIPWGYFVAPSTLPPRVRGKVEPESVLRILWVGRMLDWKRVDTLVLAVGKLCEEEPVRVSLTLVGQGPERNRLERLAQGLPVFFLPSQPIAHIREIMREHDVYVLASNSEEGWGAALNEALAEGMLVLGTHEAGASAALLPASQRFHAGNWQELANLLRQTLSTRQGFCELPNDYTPAGAAERLLNAVSAMTKVWDENSACD